MEDNIYAAFLPLIFMHLICFVILFIMYQVQTVSKKSFFHNILVVSTIPIYQFSIF